MPELERCANRGARGSAWNYPVINGTLFPPPGRVSSATKPLPGPTTLAITHAMPLGGCRDPANIPMSCGGGEGSVDAPKGCGFRYGPQLKLKGQQGRVLEAFFALPSSAGGMMAICRVASRGPSIVVRAPTGHRRPDAWFVGPSAVFIEDRLHLDGSVRLLNIVVGGRQEDGRNGRQLMGGVVEEVKKLPSAGGAQLK
jgi:hypothetical protein